MTSFKTTIPEYGDKIKKKSQSYGCPFYTGLSLFILGILLIVISQAAQLSWRDVGTYGGAILLLLGTGFLIIFWHFGKEREARRISELTSVGSMNKQVPPEIERKIDESKMKNKMSAEKANLHRLTTQNSTKTVSTTADRVVSTMSNQGIDNDGYQ